MSGNERAHGPYKHGKQWRVKIVGVDGQWEYAKEREDGPRSFATEDAAQAFVQAFKAETDNRTIGATVATYLEHLATKGGTKRKGQPLRKTSLDSASFRLRAFFGLPEGDRLLATMTVAYCRQRYQVRIKKVAVDTHRNELIVAGVFAEWCVRQGYLRFNPVREIEPEGARRAGKDVLRLDDSRRFLETALKEGSREGLACALVLVLGLRASEICDRLVNDVNIRPALLTVPKAKTRAGVRTLAVPAPLSSLLIAHVEGKERSERLFPDFTRYALHYHVQRLCKLAGVPVVCPHGLRGSAATNIVEAAGALLSPTEAVEHARRQLGHENAGMTRGAYIAPGAEESAIAAQKMALLTPPAPDTTLKPVYAEPESNVGTATENPFPIGNHEEDHAWN
jgi:integrase